MRIVRPFALVALLALWLGTLLTASSAFALCTVTSKTMTVTPSSSLYPNAGGPPAITLTYDATFVIAQSGGSGPDCTLNPVFTVQPTATGGTYSTPNCTFTFNIPNPSTNITRSGSCSMTWTAPAAPAASYTLDAGLNTGLAALQIPANTVTDITVYRTPSISVSAATPGSETGPAAATFTLTASNSVNVPTTVNLSYSGTATAGTDYTAVTTATIPANSTNAIVSVPIIDDFIVDPAETIVATVAPGSGYIVGTLVSGMATITDNDTKGVTVSGGPLTVAEPAGSATFTVRLNSQPTGDVTIALASSDTTASTPSPVSLTFTDANWNIDQTVTVNAVDDAIADGSQPSTISLTPSGGGYGAPDAVAVNVTTTDNDVAGITVSPSAVTVSEAGSTGSFSVILNSEPTGTVTVALTGNDATEASLSTASLTFTPANWNVAQTVTVTGVDDAVADGDITFALAVDPSGGDYNAVPSGSVSVTTTDNDVAGITVSPSAVTVSEAGSTGSFSVVLNSEPSGTVTVALTGNDATEASLSTASLTFTTANWNVAQTVTVTGVDDAVADGDITFVLAVDPSGGDYNAVPSGSVSVTTTDNDVAGITVAPAAITVSEAGATGSFTVVLNSEPTGDVTVALTGLDATEASLSTVSLNFTPANWNVAQTVTVTGVDDAVADGDITFNLTVTPSGGDYGSLAPQSVAITTTDDDAKGVVVTPTAINAPEVGPAGNFFVSLASQPTDTVTVTITGLDATQAGLGPSTLTFTPANWSAPQNVSVYGIDDLVADGTKNFTLTLTPTGADYDGVAPQTVAVTSTDNDVARVVVMNNEIFVAEGGPAGGTGIRLDSKPSGPVTVTVTGLDPQLATLSQTTFNFTPENWNSIQGITVTPLDNSIDRDDQSFNLIFTPSGSDYETVAAQTVTVRVADNDFADIIVSRQEIGTSEAGASDSFTVVLNSEPTGPVTVVITGLDATEASLSASSLTFTSADWNVPQTVTVTGVDDALADGDITFALTVDPSGGDYDTVPSGSVSVTNTDNDVAGITLAPSAITVSEAGAAGAFTVVLNSAPTGDVSVAITGNDATEATLSATSLTFTAANWNVPQTVTVTGVDDALADGDITFALTVDPSGGDYNAVPSGNVSVTNTDNDVAGITVAPNALTVSEAGSTGSFTVALNSAPTGDVSVALSGNDATEATLSATSLTFTAANWNVPQTVTVTGVDDALDDGDVSFSLAVAPSGADYASATPQAVAVTVTDDDAAGFSVVGGPLSVSETGTTASLTVVLSSQPTSPVVLTLATSDTSEAIVSPTSLTFTPGNWNEPQTVTVTGVDDGIVDGDVTSTLTIAVNPAASDDGFDTVPSQTVGITTSDDDTGTNAAVASAFQAQTYNFMARRNEMLASHEPKLFRMMNRTAGGATNGFTIEGDGSAIKGDFGLSASGLRRLRETSDLAVTPTADVPRLRGTMDAWIEGQFAYYKDKTDAAADTGNFLIGYAGVDYKVTDHVLLGVMAELDWMEETQSNGKVKGTGWMLGPYLTAEPADNLFFDLRAQWGKSDNSAVQQLLGTSFGGDFSTERWLIEAMVSGIYEAGDFKLTPDMRLIYIREKQDDFTVSGGGQSIGVAGQQVSLGQLSTGMKVSRSWVDGATTFEPYVSAHVAWNFDNPELLGVTANSIATDDIIGKAAIGLTISDEQTQFSAEASYDGLFSRDLHSVSGKLMFSHQF